MMASRHECSHVFGDIHRYFKAKHLYANGTALVAVPEGEHNQGLWRCGDQLHVCNPKTGQHATFLVVEDGKLKEPKCQREQTHLLDIWLPSFPLVGGTKKDGILCDLEIERIGRDPDVVERLAPCPPEA
jgi:hypothetical protein